MKSHLGKIHVYTGDGQGKTTAALGLALRAIGHGYKVIIIQFMKKRPKTGEILIQKRLSPDLEIYQFGREIFVKKEQPEQEDIEFAKKGLDFAYKALENQQPDILILDEINVAIDFNLLKVDDLLKFLDKVPRRGTEIVLTGRGAKKEIIKRADLVTEMKKIKHYYDTGLLAREGIEY